MLRFVRSSLPYLALVLLALIATALSLDREKAPGTPSGPARNLPMIMYPG